MRHISSCELHHRFITATEAAALTSPQLMDAIFLTLLTFQRDYVPQYLKYFRLLPLFRLTCNQLFSRPLVQRSLIYSQIISLLVFSWDLLTQYENKAMNLVMKYFMQCFDQKSQINYVSLESISPFVLSEHFYDHINAKMFQSCLSRWQMEAKESKTDA